MLRYFKGFTILIFVFNIFFESSAQTIVSEVYPTHWWVGMKHHQLQLMIHQKNIAVNASVRSTSSAIKILKITKPENPNYLFVDIDIASNAKPNRYKIEVKKPDSLYTIWYELKSRRMGNGTAYAQGVHSSDFIYLLMPDRFSNGDTTNDRIAELKDQSLNRDSIFLRHGGDFEGIIQHLNYLKQLGVTALWMTPVIENDMPNRTEHGYAFTNHYKIEPRLGGAKNYKRLSDSLHKYGMKLIQDAVYNHVGLYHFTVQDPPMKDWLHVWKTYTQTNYRDQTIFDPYAAQSERKQMTDGWFTEQMPDLNQSNAYVANFLIQHALWCVEEFGVDAWRIDTYIYNDLLFMNRCNEALIKEYPSITMFGEAWVGGTANEAYFARNNIKTSFQSNLISVTDFQCLFHGIQPALIHNDGCNELYQTLSNDFLYKNAMENVIFLDNHDMSRFFSQVNEDTAKQKIGVAWLLTERGIPQMYYGTEVLMKGISNPDGWVRLDFPGGWKGDKKNAFTQQGLLPSEESMLHYTKQIANYRKTSSALTQGKLMHYIPKNGLYVYFRYTREQTVMCIMNVSNEEKNIDFKNYIERTNGFHTAVNIITNEVLGKQFPIPPKTMWVLELKKE